MLTGCWNYKELNNLGITTGIGIDKSEEGYEITLMIANSQKQTNSSSNGRASNDIFTGNGRTLYEAIKDAAMSISKEVYLGHIEVLIISEEVAKDGIQEVIDFIFRYPQARNDFHVAISNNCKAGDILKITGPLDTISTQNIAQNLKITNRLQGFTHTVKCIELVNHLINEGINPVLPSILIIGDVEKGNEDKNIERSEPETYVKLGMLGIFKKDKFIKFADRNESKGINIINNKINITLLALNYNGINVNLEVDDLKTKKKIKDNKIIVETKIISSIQETSEHLNLTDPKIIEEIRKIGVEEVKRLIESAIKVTKDNKTDIFGFGNLIYKDDFKKWNNIKDKWEDEIYEKTEVQIEIDLKLQAKGTINTGIEVD